MCEPPVAHVTFVDCGPFTDCILLCTTKSVLDRCGLMNALWTDLAYRVGRTGVGGLIRHYTSFQHHRLMPDNLSAASSDTGSVNQHSCDIGCHTAWRSYDGHDPLNILNESPCRFILGCRE